MTSRDGKTGREDSPRTGIEEEIREGRAALSAISRLVPAGGLKDPEGVMADMEEMISQDFEPYFSANAALHILARCQRCGRCCREERQVALSDQDARRIAGFLGISRRSFLHRYSQPHTLKGPLIGSARLIKKEDGRACPFFDPQLPGCQVHQVKPQVCRAAFYLSKMNLLTCQREGRINRFSSCPADVEMRAEMEELARRMIEDKEAWADLAGTGASSTTGWGLFRLLLRLKGMEIYFGEEKVRPLIRRLGLAEIPGDDSVRPLARLYAAAVLIREGRDKDG